jgi:hypothetical protein
VKDLFESKQQQGLAVASLSSVRTELMETGKNELPALLTKYSQKNFEERTKSFWCKLHRVQKPTHMELLMQVLQKDPEPPGSGQGRRSLMQLQPHHLHGDHRKPPSQY